MLDLNRIFELATEDASTLTWALDAWAAQSKDYSPGYLLLQALASCARADRALAILEATALPPEFAPYLGKLHRLQAVNRDRLNAVCHEPAPMIAALFAGDGELSQRLEAARKLLEKLARQADFDVHQGLPAADDKRASAPNLAPRLDRSQDEPRASENFRDAATDFLLLFSDLYRAASLEPNPLQGIAGCAEWMAAFGDLARRFGEVYGLFEAVGEMLESVSEREYGTDLRCFARSSAGAEEATGECSDEWLKRAYRGARSAIATPCPAPEQVIAFGLAELPEKDARSVREHVAQCWECLELALDARAAAAAPILPLPPKLEAVLRTPWRYPTFEALQTVATRLLPPIRFPALARGDAAGDQAPLAQPGDWLVALLQAEPMRAGVLAHAASAEPLGKLVTVRGTEMVGIEILELEMAAPETVENGFRVTGTIKASGPLPADADLLCTWIEADGTVLWAPPRSVVWQPDQGTFAALFPGVPLPPDGMLRLLVTVRCG